MRAFPDELYKVAPFDELLETEGGVCVLVTKLQKAGYVVPQHAHDHGHTTLVANGAVALWIDGDYAGDFVAPCVKYIQPNTKHVYQALVDNCVLACISRQEN